MFCDDKGHTMKFLKMILFTLPLLLLPSLAAAGQAAYPATEEALMSELQAMPWQEGGTHQMAVSSSSIKISTGWEYLDAEAAQRYLYLLNGTEFELVEGVAVNWDTEELFTFDHYDSGYVTLDDWEDMDAATLLQQIIDGTEAANVERREMGISEMHVIGWLQEPYLDRETNAAYWAIEAVDEESGPIINYVAMKLGRKGYEELTWVGTKEQFSGAPATMTAMLGAHTFDSGFRYADFTTGDKLAGVGIAALVAASAGGSSNGKVGFFAALVLLLKKFIAFIVAGVVAVGAALKRLITGKVGEEDATPPPPDQNTTAV